MGKSEELHACIRQRRGVKGGRRNVGNVNRLRRVITWVIHLKIRDTRCAME